MIGQTIVFDGHRLNDRFYVGEVIVGLPEFVPTLEERAAGDGSVFRGKRLGTLDIEMRLVAKPVQGETPRDAISDLISWLDVDEPKQLSLSRDRGLWRMVVPNGAPTIEDTNYEDVVIVRFTQVEPALYGRLRSVSVPSGGSVTVMVGGDYPTKPTITAGAAVRNSSWLWGVLLDSGDFLRVKVPTSSASKVVMDCASRVCTVAGATTAPTITSDWFEIEPGSHVIRNDQGTGACTVTWYERWHA